MPGPSQESCKQINKVERVYKSHHFNSEVWDDVKPRADDIFICTSYKSGTTWAQQQVGVMLKAAGQLPEELNNQEVSPWVELKVPPREVKMPMIEAQQHRRFLKSHLPANALPIYDKPKYIVVIRDGLDSWMSLMNHFQSFNDMAYAVINDPANLHGPPMPGQEEFADAGKAFDRWLTEPWSTLPWEKDGWPAWSVFTHLATWWELAKTTGASNIKFVHFNNMKADLEGHMRDLAKFLGVYDKIAESQWPSLVEKCTFEYMKAHAPEVAPLGGAMWGAGGEDGASKFINKGTNQRWKEVLSDAQVAQYREAARERLPPEAAVFMETGKMPAA